MNPFKWITNKFVDIWKKLTEENVPEINKFLGGFHRLSIGETQYVLDLINEEVERSAKYKLFITKEDVLKEKVAILFVLDRLGGIIRIRENFLSRNDNLFEFFSKCVFEVLEGQVSHYFQYTPPGEVRTKYNCHLTAVAGRIANDILNDNVSTK